MNYDSVLMNYDAASQKPYKTLGTLDICIVHPMNYDFALMNYDSASHHPYKTLGKP